MENKDITTFSISDNLNMSDLNVPEIPKDVLFPDELNRYLRDQVQYLTHENGMLYKNLSNAETQLKQSSTKINDLSSQLEEYQSTCSKNNLANSATNLASKKIVELSKKLRERNSEVEIYKTKCSKLQQHIVGLEKDKDMEEELCTEIPEKPKNELEEQIHALQDKLSSINTKLCESRNSNLQLKNDLKLANKLLQQEVGDNFDNLQAMVNSNTNWRGRAQIICDLQHKNNDLREKVKIYQEKDKGHVVNEHPVQTKWDKRLESLTNENAELKNSVLEFKRKLEATRARNKVLESEYSVLRAKLGAIVEQSERDHEMIASLTAKLSQSHEMQSDAVRQKHVIIQKVEQENKELQMEISKHECKLNNLNAIIDEQNRQIENLRKKNKNQQQPLSPTNVASINTQSSKILEAERIRLLELTKHLNERLEAERIAHSETETKFRTERQKSAKLETKVACLQLEQKNDVASNYGSYASLKSKESDYTSEDRLQLLEETVKALQTRLQLERQEHKNDIEEFSKILKNYGFIHNTV